MPPRALQITEEPHVGLTNDAIRRLRLRISLICSVFSSVFLLNLVGCGIDEWWKAGKSPQSPLDAMNAEIRQGHWDEAWLLSDEVLSEHPADPRVLAKLARVAFESQHAAKSAEWLMAACRAESFIDEGRVEQAVVAAIFVGRLFDAIEFLAAAVDAQPDQLQTRRLIFDLLRGLDNRTLAQPHGRFLVKKRRFDVELITSLCNTGPNLPEGDSITTMLARNPSDKRPLITKAMESLAKGLYQDAIEQLEAILDQHAEYVQAQILLGECLVAAGQFASLENWHSRLQGDYESEVGYWITLGDWAASRQDHSGAARAYWEATKRDSYVLKAWTGLRNELGQLPAAEAKATEPELAAIDNRIGQLRRLKAACTRFVKSRSISRATAMEIAVTLEGLGRLWEAEAWSAIASTLPEDPSVDTVAVRQGIVAKLSQDTPWVVREGHPELELDLSHLALPQVSPKRPTTAGQDSSKS